MKLILIAAWSCLLACSPCSAQSEEDIEWVNKHFRSVMEELMPIGKETGSYVGFRSHRDLHNNVLEYSLLLKLNYQTNQVEAVVRVADSVTFYDQLMSLHRRNPAQSIDTLKKQLMVKEVRIGEADCPALKSQFRKFSKIQFRAPDPYLIILHPMVYEFQISPVSEYMRLVVVESDHPLVAWVLNTGRILETCVVRINRS